MPRTIARPETVAAASAELSPLELHALAKAPRGLDKLRDRLDVADGQLVDFTVRVRGAVNVAADASSTLDQEPPAEVVLAVACGVLSRRARAEVREHVAQAFAEWREGAELPTLPAADVDYADDLMRACARRVTKSKRGNVSASLAVELVKRGGR